jgi:hypothetical protein
MKVLATTASRAVGKTTAVAADARRSGGRVLVWDLDPQGAATYSSVPGRREGGGRLVGLKASSPTHPRLRPRRPTSPPDFPLRHLDVSWTTSSGRPTDSPPPRAARRANATSPSSTARRRSRWPPESVFGAADALLVPTIPTPSRRCAAQRFRTTEEVRARSLADELTFGARNTNRAGDELEAELRAAFPAILEAAMPNSSVVEQMADHRAPVAAFAAHSAPAIAVRALWAQIADIIWR